MGFSEKVFNKLREDAEIIQLVHQAIEAINTPFYDNCHNDISEEVGRKLNWNYIPLDLVDALITYHCHLLNIKEPE